GNECNVGMTGNVDQPAKDVHAHRRWRKWLIIFGQCQELGRLNSFLQNRLGAAEWQACRRYRLIERIERREPHPGGEFRNAPGLLDISLFPAVATGEPVDLEGAGDARDLAIVDPGPFSRLVKRAVAYEAVNCLRLA